MPRWPRRLAKAGRGWSAVWGARNAASGPFPSANCFNTPASFNGSNSFIELQGSSGMNLLPVTISLWVKSQPGSGADIGLVAKSGISSANGFGLFATGSSVRAWYYAQEVANGGNVYVTSTPFLDGNWHHVAFTYDANAKTGTMYRDGVVFDTKTNETIVFDGKAGQFVLGGFQEAASIVDTYAHNTWMGYFTGSIDQLRMYNVALSAGDVANLYNNKQ